jgi:opacity protein-like surface antigen
LPTAQPARLLLFCCVALLLPAALAAQAAPQEDQPYARVNSFGFLVAYSNDSSHMILGNVEQRKILNIGASYSRRLFLNHVVNWQYDGEILPVALDSDPVQTITETITYNTNPPNTVSGTTSNPLANTRCTPVSETFTGTEGTVTFMGTVVVTCTRRWVYGGGMSPIGFRWSFLPQRKVQPFLGGHGGFMESTQQIPINYAGTFNFTFDFDAGFEWYRTHSRSLRFEYRYHHISDHNLTTYNPGIDNSLFQVSYVFGH